MTEPVTLIADLFPGTVLDAETGQRIAGIPGKGTKLHVIVSTTTIAIGWDAGTVNGVAQVGSLLVDISGMDTTDLDHNGGVVGPYEIKRAGAARVAPP
jgi:hypothetical protein